MLRPLVAQESTAFTFVVPAAPAASPAPQYSLDSMIDSFVVTVPQAAANSVFMGFNPGLIVGNGIELLASTTVAFRIHHEGRQLYEIQRLLKRLVDFQTCQISQEEQIPVVMWDMSQIYMVAAAPTTITMCVFKAVYV